MDLITYALCKKYIKQALDGAGALKGLSAFEVAQENGFEGTEAEWLESLKGEPGYTPYIGENGNWFVNEEDTGVLASSGIKITSVKNSSEIIVDEDEQAIFSMLDGVKTLVANYTQTDAIEDQSINGLFI